jgi:hypothetical protein
MNNALNSLENNALAALSARAPTGVLNAIKTASAKTGVSFSYLMEKAAAESNFNPDIRAKTSSATGLFQFIESTWMDMVDKHGAKYGIDKSQSKSDLLNLRKDPSISSFMAAEFAEGNKAHLEKTIGGDIGNTELYFAHFMGAGGASAFLGQLEKNPLSVAADIFPKEARANKGVFYDRGTGAPKTLQQVYDFFDKKFSGDTRVAEAPENTVETMAHKPKSKGEIRSAGYQHIPFSLQKSIQIEDSSSYNRTVNSLYQIQSQLDAFFAQPAGFGNDFSGSLYGDLRNPSSVLLDILR